jgi:hypothetical protein
MADEREQPEPGAAGEWLPPAPPREPPPSLVRPPLPPPQQPPQRPPVYQPPAPPQPPSRPPAYQPPAPPQPPSPYGHPAPAHQQPAPAAPPPPTYPYPHPPQQGYPPQGWQPLPPQPPNDDAVVGFTCAVVGAALLFFTAGLSTIVSLTLGIVAIPYSRKGKRKIAAGETTKHKDLAGAGYIIGIITIVVSILAMIAWGLIFALVDWEEVEEDLEEESEGESVRFYIRTGVALFARLLG